MLHNLEAELPGTGERRNWGEVDQGLQNLLHELNKFWRPNVQSCDPS